MPRRSFRLPDPDKSQARWGVASTLIHAVVAAILVSWVGHSVVTRTTIRFIDLGAPTGTRQSAVPVFADGPPSAPAVAPAREPSPSGAVRVVPRVDIVPEVAPIGVPDRRFSDYDPILGRTPLVGLEYGDGRFWVGPLDARLGLSGSSDPLTHAEKVDSALKARILAFIDTLPPDGFRTADIPKWTRDIDGKTWGVDEKWVYLGDLKIPSAILALIPAPQGNYYQAKDAQALAAVREQIIYSARVADNRADFNRYVKEIRKRKDAEREARKRAKLIVEEIAKKPAKRDTIIP